MNIRLYGKSRLGEDFMINGTFFKDKKVDATLKVRSKDQAVLNMIVKKLKEIVFENEESDEWKIDWINIDKYFVVVDKIQ